MKLFLTILTGAISLGATAQVKKVAADKIIGKVGDRIILQSDIQNAIYDNQRAGEALPPDADCYFMSRELIQKAMVLQAEKDSLVVEDEYVESQIENRIRAFIRNYGSKEALEEISGRTVYQLKEDFRTAFKEAELAKKMQEEIIKNVRITPAEVQAFYNAIPKDSLPFYESEVELGQVVIYPKANRDVESYTAKQLNDIKKEVESGRSRFDQMAKLYSEDPAVKENGGQYTLNKADNFWDPAFLSAAFRLKEGQISNVVKSKFGLHILQCVSRNGDDVVVRHILMIPIITEDEIGESKKRLDSARSLLIAGNISFGEAVAKYGELEDKFSGGWVMNPYDQSTLITLDQVDKTMLPALKGMKAGEYSPVESFTDERGRKGVRFLYLRTRTEPHRENLLQDYNKIADRALAYKKQQVLDGWFTDHLKNYYIYVDPGFNSCADMQPWIEASEANSKKMAGK